MSAAAKGRLSEAQHAPADGVAIAAVARGAVIALHGVLAEEIEEGAVLFLECGSDLELLSRSCVRERVTEAIASDCVGLLKTFAIGKLVTAIVARELAVDVGDDSGLRGAGKIVSGNDLIAKECKNAGVVVAQELPVVAGVAVAAEERSCAAESACQSKLPSRESAF